MRSSNRTLYLSTAIILFGILYWLSKASNVVLDQPVSGAEHQRHAANKEPVDQYGGAKPSGRNDGHNDSHDLDDATDIPVPVRQVSIADHSFPAKFPRKIWQTSGEEGRTKYAKQIDTWKNIRGFEHEMLSDDAATDFVHTHFSHRPSIVRFWNELSTVVLRADLLRYLVMLSEGGVYSDVDTSCLVHPDQWIPIDQGAQTINAIIGLEYDDTTYKLFVRPISFCQWTLMAKPNHPIFHNAVQRVISNLEFIARRQRTTLDTIKPDKADVLAATGPGMITDVVMQTLRDQGHDVSWETFHNMTEAKVFGDVLILPINGFAGAQKHSHAGNPAYGTRLVTHHFGRSWYKKPEPLPAAESKKEDAEHTRDKDMNDVTDSKEEKEKEKNKKDQKMESGNSKALDAETTDDEAEASPDEKI